MIIIIKRAVFVSILSFLSYLLVFCLISFISQAQASIINIPDDYDTIQEGIEAAISGDTVLVYPGTYSENVNLAGKNMTLGSRYLITNDTAYVGSTIINGSGARECILAIENGESDACLIVGFTIQGGRDGGIRCANSSPTIVHNYIVGNTSPRDGAGIYCANASPHILRNAISGNIAGYHTGLGNGGGMFCFNNSNAFIDSNIISGNEAIGGGAISVVNRSIASISGNCIYGNHADIGGGIHVHSYSEATISHNSMVANSADWWGGCAFINQSTALIEYNLMATNYSDRLGGCGFFSYSNIEMMNNTACHNTAADSGGGFWYTHCIVTQTNSIQWGNQSYRHNEIFYNGDSLVNRYCDLGFTWPGDGNITIEPLFIDVPGGDYHLQSGSPCIDSGDPQSPLDPDSTRCDMGAFYYNQFADIYDGNSLPDLITLKQNYPNPFNGSTVISYSLDRSAHVKVEMFDIAGRRVMTVVNDYQNAGLHSVMLNAPGCASGIYFYRLTAGEYSLSRKMLLCK